MAKRAPNWGGTKGRGMNWELGQLPHGGHEGGIFRALHEADFAAGLGIVIAAAPVEYTPELLPFLAGGRLGGRKLALRGTPFLHRAG